MKIRHLIFIAAIYANFFVLTSGNRLNSCPNELNFRLFNNQNLCRPDEIFDYLSELSPSHVTMTSSTTKEPVTEKHVMAEDLRTRDDEPQIASFDEWTKQKMQEQRTRGADEKPAVPGSQGKSEPAMKATRNYASKECGAKILAANPEAQNPSAVLNEKERDEYMLNPCMTEGQKWLVVELCETVQITRFELANFELFSSRPKDFKVWISERYPSPDWSPLGQWAAFDKREPHGFDVEPRGYAKYLKLELISHYGNEHFCSLTLIRVFGISMVEEYENEALSHQPLSEPMTSSKSDDLVNDTTTVNHTNPSIDNSTKSVPTVTQQEDQVQEQMFQAADNGYLSNARLAVMSMAKEVYGKVFKVAPEASAADPGGQTVVPNFAAGLIPPPNNDSTCASNGSTGANNTALKSGRKFHRSIPWAQCIQCAIETEIENQQEKPKFCSYFLLFVNFSRILLLKNQQNDEIHVEKSEEILTNQNNSAKNLANQEPAVQKEAPIKDTTPPPVQIQAQINSNNDSAQNGAAGQNAPVLPGIVTSSKESVFVRLNSRIRALELNISLSGQYLGELSRKYRRQMEDIQRAFNATSRLFSETDAKFEQRLEQQAKDLHAIQEQLAGLGPALEKALIERVTSGPEVAQWLIVGFLVEILILFVFYRLAKFWQFSDHRLEMMVERAVANHLAKNQPHAPLVKNGPITWQPALIGPPKMVPNENGPIMAMTEPLAFPSCPNFQLDESKFDEEPFQKVPKKKKNKRKQQQNQQNQTFFQKTGHQSSSLSSQNLSRDSSQSVLVRKISAEPPKKASGSNAIGRKSDDQSSTMTSGILFTGGATNTSMTSSGAPTNQNRWPPFCAAPNLKVTNQFQALGSPLVNPMLRGRRQDALKGPS